MRICAVKISQNNLDRHHDARHIQILTNLVVNHLSYTKKGLVTAFLVSCLVCGDCNGCRKIMMKHNGLQLPIAFLGRFCM